MMASFAGMSASYRRAIIIGAALLVVFVAVGMIRDGGIG